MALAQLLVEQNFPAICIHRGMPQEERYVCTHNLLVLLSNVGYLMGYCPHELCPSGMELTAVVSTQLLHDAESIHSVGKKCCLPRPSLSVPSGWQEVREKVQTTAYSLSFPEPLVGSYCGR